MTTRAPLCKSSFASVQFGIVLSQVLATYRSVFEQIWLSGLKKKKSHIRCLRNRRVPVAGVSLGVLDPDGRNPFATNQGIKMKQPFLAKQSDIDKHTIESTEKSNRIGSILEHARCPYGIRTFVKFRERSGLSKRLELFVRAAASCESFLTPTQCSSEPRADAVDRVHRAWIIDVIGGYKRSIQGAWQR